MSDPTLTPTPNTRTLTLPDGRTIAIPDGTTVVIASADGQTFDLSPRGMTIDRADCLIIDDPAPRPAPPSSLLTVTADPRQIEAMRRLRVSLETAEEWKAYDASFLQSHPSDPIGTWSRPMRASQRASEERRPGAMWAANQKRWRRGLRNLRNRQREREAHIRQEARVDLHDLTRPERPARVRLPEPARTPPTVDFRGGVWVSNDLMRPGGAT